MKKIISLFLSIVIMLSALSVSTISYSATKPYCEDKLEEVQKKQGFVPNKTAKITGNCYGFISAVCEELHGVAYNGEGIYGNYRARHETGNYHTVSTYETQSTTPTASINKAIRNFFINNAQPGDVVHYGAYTTGTSNYSTHTFMIQHIDREKMQIFHSNYETRTLPRDSCHIDTIVWDSFVNDSTKAIYNDDGSLYSHNNLFYNKMKSTGLGISINRLTGYKQKYRMVDNSLSTTAPAPEAQKIPEKVTELEVTSIKAESIGIRWKKVDDADKYYIAITNDTKGTSFDKTVTENYTSLNNLTENNKYTIKVRAINKAGNGKYSNSITVKAESQTGIVKNLVATGRTVSTISYKWDKVENATKYYMEIENKTKGGSYEKTITTNTATIQGLTEGNVYSVRVRAYTNKGGWGTFSDNLVTASKPARVKITSLSSPKATKLRVQWKSAVGNKTGYQMVFATDKAFSKNVYKKTLANKDAVSYSKSNFKKGKTYYARVRAYVTVNGKSYYGNWSEVMTVKCK